MAFASTQPTPKEIPMHRWLYFFVTFCGLALLLFIGFRLLPVSSAIADAGCSTPLTKAELTQPLNTDPSGGCPDDPSQDTVTPSLKQPAPKSERYFFLFNPRLHPQPTR